MDDRRITVLETRFDCIFPTLATKRDVETLRAEILSELRKRDIAHHPSIANPAEDYARTFRNLKIWGSILVGAVWIFAISMSAALYLEGERIIADRQTVANAAQAGSAPPAAILNSGNERH